jgi:hypothetical protein
MLFTPNLIQARESIRIEIRPDVPSSFLSED